MFQNSVGPLSTPCTLRRQAVGWKNWPSGM
jgi:hypothetical protein